MKKITTILLLIIICAMSFAQMPQWKKQILIGSAITVGAAGCITGAVFTLPRGFVLLEDEDAIGPAIGLIFGGCLLASAGIAGAIAGPIVIAHGVKARREEREEQETSLIFKPIQNRLLDKYQCSLNSQKFVSFSFMF